MLAVGSISRLQSQDLFDYAHSKEFAKYLYNSKNYEQATWEFERLISLRGDDDTIKFFLINSYRHSGNIRKGSLRTRELYKNLTIAPPDIANEYSILLLLNNDFDTLDHYLKTSLTIPVDKKLEMSMYSSLLNRDWDNARLHYMDYQKYSIQNNDMNDIFNQIDELQYKSPFLAATMSTFIPGTGKIYSGYWKDGLFTLGVVGVSSWQAYRGFKTDGNESVYGWIFTGLTGVIYLSNIYGSQKAAKSINTRRDNEILRKVYTIITNQ